MLNKADAKFRAWNIVKKDYEMNGRPNATLANSEFRDSVELEMKRILKEANKKAPKEKVELVDYEANERSMIDSPLLGATASYKDASEYIVGTPGTKRGITYLAAVKIKLDGVKELAYVDLLTELAIEYKRDTDAIGWGVRAALRHMEYKGEIQNVEDPSSDSVMINATAINTRRIINLQYVEPKEAEAEGTDAFVKFFPKATSKTGLMDLDTEVKVADMLKYTTVDQRARMFTRAIESARAKK